MKGKVEQQVLSGGKEDFSMLCILSYLKDYHVMLGNESVNIVNIGGGGEEEKEEEEEVVEKKRREKEEE